MVSQQTLYSDGSFVVFSDYSLSVADTLSSKPRTLVKLMSCPEKEPTLNLSAAVPIANVRSLVVLSEMTLGFDSDARSASS
jgi:hypothetical protein